jgi:hypothetical protein
MLPLKAIEFITVIPRNRLNLRTLTFEFDPSIASARSYSRRVLILLRYSTAEESPYLVRVSYCC